MSERSRVDQPPVPSAGRSQVLAWALWDCGATGLNAIVVTFVFSVYLTGAVGGDLPGDTSPSSLLGRALAIAGLTVALLAPAIGIWVDAPGRRRRVLAALTALAVVLTSAMSLVRDDYHYLWLGLVLLAAAATCNDLATVPYNAMLRQLSTPLTSGRVSGFGLAMGYLGSVVLLLVAYLGFIGGDGDTRGFLGLPVEGGQNVRGVMLLTAAWFALFALPLIFGAPDGLPELQGEKVGFFGAYRKLWSEISGEWKRDHNIVYYLFASAVFRDGLAGVFTFGAVLGVNVYGVSDADVLLFGVSACVVAAAGAVVGGLFDDRLGSKPVIVGALTLMITVGLTLLSLSGPVAFWVCGLLLCLFIGPTLASGRTLMMRMSMDGKEGVAFGLYATTGRAVSFLAPWLFFTFIDVFDTDRAGIGGLCVVLSIGLVAMLAVKTPGRMSIG
ncbi:MFS transporter [Mycobacterium hubeiense]|uniref:MFS transporter n=1 Tax=Mycobacterium hubeiense TaxID=1867256 RepID=UPI000C7F6F78|nr:MFS transporter [Mycobacterium sp. QGD 101]